MKVKEIAVEKIIPYHLNPKLHPEVQVEKLAQEISAFKWDQPIVVDKEMVVIKGHGRLLAAQALGLKTVPVVVADYLTPEEVTAARLADNKVSESEWDPQLLAGEFQALLDLGFDLELTGFEEHERREFLEVGEKTSLGNPGDKKSRNLGKGQMRVKPVLAVEDVATFEKALRATGEMNRGRALIMICEAYLGTKESAKGQFDPGLEDFFKA